MPTVEQRVDGVCQIGERGTSKALVLRCVHAIRNPRRCDSSLPRSLLWGDPAECRTKTILMPHEIRLAGPWEVCHDGDDWERCVLPFPADDSPDVADFRLRRKFHRPSGLDEQSQVAIVVTINGDLLAAKLNGTDTLTGATESDGTVVFDVTGRLQESNTVELSVPAPTTVTAVRLRIVQPGEA